MEIETQFVYPPIPIRTFDWCAHLKDKEGGPFGWGATEQEAIDDLKEQMEED